MDANAHASGCSCAEESEEQKAARVAEIIETFKGREGSLIQVLHLVQGVYGHLSLEVQRVVADALGLPLSEVTGVTSFYSFFSTEPRGEYSIRVCLGTACYVRGSAKILKRLSDTLGVEVGQTTKDRKFTLEVMRCLGACGLAPAVMVNDTVVRQVNPDKLHRIFQLCH